MRRSTSRFFCEAIYESLRGFGAKEGVLAAWCITADARKVLLHLAAGNKESEACWTEFFRRMARRGLRVPTTVTSDGAPGLVNAIEQVFGKSIRVRCWFHKMANIRSKLPAEAADEVLAYVRVVRDAPTWRPARQCPRPSSSVSVIGFPQRWPVSPTTWRPPLAT